MTLGAWNGPWGAFLKIVPRFRVHITVQVDLWAQGEARTDYLRPRLKKQGLKQSSSALFDIIITRRLRSQQRLLTGNYCSGCCQSISAIRAHACAHLRTLATQFDGKLSCQELHGQTLPQLRRWYCWCCCCPKLHTGQVIAHMGFVIDSFSNSWCHHRLNNK